MNILLKIKILTRLILIIFNKNVHKAVKQYILLFEGIRRKSGIKYAIRYFKVSKLHITRYISGNPLKSNRELVSLDQDYFPKRLNLLKELIESNDLRIVLTILGYTRSIIPTKKEKQGIKPDFSSITNPYKGKVYTIPKSFIKEFVIKFNLLSNKPVYSDNDHYVSMKGSPNGPSSYSSLWSIILLSYPQLDYICKMVGDYFSESLSPLYNFSWNMEKTLDLNKRSTGKLSIVEDPELKMRIIAMLDYTSQFVLKPIHENILNKLKNFPCDRTFTQDPKHPWKVNQEKFFSLDLSSATDRFPIELQTKLLLYIYNNDLDFVQSWKSLLINRNFQVGETTEYLRYSVGQPMGAYSSWAVFTITHHLVVQYAARLCGYIDFNDYILLGDDIVIKNNKVAHKYITLMTRWGVDISPTKTHVSIDTYEFAKRWIKNGKEITGVPLKGLFQNWNNPFIVYGELLNYLSKLPIHRGTVLDLVAKLYDKLPYRFSKKMRIHSSKKIYNLLYDFHFSMRFSFGNLTYDEFRNYIMKKNPYESFTLPSFDQFPSYMKGIISDGLENEAAKVSSDILKQYTSFETKFQEEYIDLNVLSDWPLIKGYYNHLNNLKKLIKDYNSESISLIDSALGMRLNNFDKIVAMHRNKSEAMTHLGKLWKKSIALVLYEPSELDLMLPKYYGLSSNKWEYAIDTNLDFTINKFKIIIDKKLKTNDPETVTNSWSSLSWDMVN